MVEAGLLIDGDGPDDSCGKRVSAVEEAGAAWPGVVGHPGEREPLNGERCSGTVDPAMPPPEVVAAVVEAGAARTGVGPVMPPPKVETDVTEAGAARTDVGPGTPPPNAVAAVIEAGAVCTGVGPAMPPPNAVAAATEVGAARTGVGPGMPLPNAVAAVFEAGSARTAVGPVMPPPKVDTDVTGARAARTGVGPGTPPPNAVAAVIEAGAACTGVGPAMPLPKYVATVTEAGAARTGVGPGTPPPKVSPQSLKPGLRGQASAPIPEGDPLPSTAGVSFLSATRARHPTTLSPYLCGLCPRLPQRLGRLPFQSPEMWQPLGEDLLASPPSSRLRSRKEPPRSLRARNQVPARVETSALSATFSF